MNNTERVVNALQRHTQLGKAVCEDITAILNDEGVLMPDTDMHYEYTAQIDAVREQVYAWTRDGEIYPTRNPMHADWHSDYDNAAALAKRATDQFGLTTCVVRRLTTQPELAE